MGGLGDLGGIACLGVPGGLCDPGADMQKPGDIVCTNFLQHCSYFGFACIFCVCFLCFCKFWHVYAHFLMLIVLATFPGLNFCLS